MIDLHLHTIYSDGSNTVEEIFKIAKSLNLSSISITDHDILEGTKKGAEISSNFGINFINGVEITTRCKGDRELHILGYLFDENNEELNNTLQWIRDTRRLRNVELIELLNKLGYEVTLDELEKIAGKKDNIGRPHFAKLLIKNGYFSNFDEVFQNLLGEGKKGYIEKKAITPYDAIDIIHKAGGVAVLAHPLSYWYKDLDEVNDLIGNLAAEGLDGLEAVYVKYSDSEKDWIKRKAESLDLIITGGSDYHGKYKPNISLGRGLGNLNVPDILVDKLYERKLKKKL